MLFHVPIFSRVIAEKGDIKREIERLAWAINSEYNGKKIVIVAVMKGAFMFAADLARAINEQEATRKCEIEAIDFIGASSYGDQTESSGTITITYPLTTNIAGKDVLLVDDVLDSGQTLASLKQELLKRNPYSLKTAVLIRKGGALDKKPIEPDFIGFRVTDPGFIVGYGLDYANRYRDQPRIGILRPNLIKN